MGVQDPPQLLDLADLSLPWNEALAIMALEELPLELFPPLFMVAFAGRHTQALNVVVQSRPFPCLCLGTLMKEHQPHLESFQAPLDDLDVLLAQGVQPRLASSGLIRALPRAGERQAVLSPPPMGTGCDCFLSWRSQALRFSVGP
ncbi:hypothetical protein R6Z07M_019754 [Ovis aries]